MKTKFLNIIAVAALILGIIACKKNVPPTVTIENNISVSYTSANVTGNVTNEGGSAVTDRGFIYGKQGGSKIDTAYCGSGGGEFPTRLTGLEQGTTYNCEAFATNSNGTAYSGKTTFTTLAVLLSGVTTSEVSNISYTSATCGGSVDSDGGGEVTERGVCWGANPNPETSGTHLSNGTGTGEFEVNLVGLTPNTTYYVRAYAVNSKGTNYGDNVSFKTLSYNAPSITTSAATNISYTSVTCGGNIESDGGLNITEKGVCWGTSQNPTTSDSHLTSGGTNLGNFSVNITGLTPNTDYYLRAYATNSNGTSYGDNVTIKTIDYSKPSVTTQNVTDITANSITIGGNVTQDGGSNVTARGVCWSTSSNPTVSGSHTTDGSGTGSFTSTITGLTQNTTYYVRAYATNSKGTSYGDTKQITTTKPYYLISEGGTVTISHGFFYDSGGPNGNYSNNEDYVMTFQPATNGKIRVTFTRFEVDESSYSAYYDYLYIYNGPTASGSPTAIYSGFNSPGTVTANSPDGSLTFKWHSGSSYTKAGWEATISVVQ